MAQKEAKTTTTIVVNPDNYQAITKSPNVGLQQFLELQQKAKHLKSMQQGMQSPETIPYKSLSDLAEGESIDVMYVTRIIEDRIDEKTGEPYKLAVMVLMLEDGTMIRNGAFLVSQHFYNQKRGYAAKIIFTGTKKTQTGNKMDRIVIYPLLPTA